MLFRSRISARDYVDYYVNGGHADRNKKPASEQGSTGSCKTDVTSPAPVKIVAQPVSSPADEIPMEVYEAEAKAMFGDVPPPDVPLAEVLAAEDTVPATPDRPHTPVPTDFPVATEEILVSSATAPYRMVGEVFHSYVIVEQGDRMLLIDKHAAHERIIFEGLKANMKEKSVDSQLLMLPIEVMLMSEEVGLLDAYRRELEAVGFSYSCLRNTVRVDSIPSGIEAGAVPDMLATIVEQLKNGVDTAKLTRDILFEKALYQASCKAAIKAGRDYPPEHIQWLVDQLMAIPDITFCPHGRPVAMEMKKRNIDHQFERC